MGSNFHTPWTGATLFRDTSMNPALASLDKGITYLKNVIVHTDGAITYNKTTGQLAWASTLRILFNREDGQAIQNTVSAGNITLADNEFAYVTLNETNNTVLTVSKAAINTGIASNFLAVGILVLVYRNSGSDELFPVYLRPYLINIPIETSKGGTGLSVIGIANQVAGVNNGTTALEYKTINGTSNEITVTHAANSITISLSTIRYASITLSNSDIKNLRTSPKTIVVAPGTNMLIEFISATLLLKAGSEVLTESDDNMTIRYNDGSGVIVSETIETTGFIDQIANTLTRSIPIKDAIVASTNAGNKALVLHNTGDGEYAGNASNDATMVVKIMYMIHDVS